MGSPRTKRYTEGLDILLRHGCPTKPDDWERLLNERIRMLGGIVRLITLQTIGTVPLLLDNTLKRHSFRDDLVKVASESCQESALKGLKDNLPLNTPGIFFELIRGATSKEGLAHVWFWGVARGGKVILGAVAYYEHRDDSGEQMDYQEGRYIEAKLSSVQEICRFADTSCRTLWEDTGHAVRMFVRQRAKALRAAQSILADVKAEESALKLLSVTL